eukprot:gene7468-11792_t
MLKTHQVILGSANLNNSSLSWVKYLGTEYMAYASENNVIINSLTSFIQILRGHQENITCIEWCDSLGKLISCSKGKIIIFQPEEQNFNLSESAPSIQMQWKIEKTIIIPDFDIKCVSWNPYGNRFLVAGQETRLYELVSGNWVLKWKIKNPTECTMISFSPDERLFATSSKNNRIVKVWFQTKVKEKEDFSYIYLPHQRAVTSFEWRPIPKSNNFVPNVLMTICKGNVLRMWSETFKSEELYFFVTYSETFKKSFVAQWIKRPYELLPVEIIESQLNYTKGIEGDHDDITKESLEEQTFGALKESQEETINWVARIEKNGDLHISTIRALGEFPRRTPKSEDWIEMKGAFEGIETPLKLLTMYNAESDDSFELPSTITFVIQNQHGTITSYDLNLKHQKEGKPEQNLSLEHVYTGHTGNISLIVSHFTLPLVASYESKTNTLIVWHKRDTDYFSPINILTNVQDYYGVDATDMCWMTYEPGLFISTKTGIELFLVKAPNPVDDFNDDSEDEFAPLISYYGMKKSDMILDNSNEFTENMIIQVVPMHFSNSSKFFNNTILVAVSKTGEKFGIWRVYPIDESGKLFSSKLLFIHEFDKSIKVTSADVTPFKPFLYKEETNLEDDKFSKSFLFVVGCSDGSVTTYKITITDNDENKTVEMESEEEEEEISDESEEDSEEEESEEEEEEEEVKPPVSFKSLMSLPKPKAKKNKIKKKKENQIISMEEQTSFKTEDGEIAIVSIPIGLTRLCSYSKGGKYVNIWETESSTSYSLEQSIPVNNVNCVRWVSLGNGQNILTVATDEGLFAYTQGNLTEKKNSKYWKRIGKLQSEVCGACTALSITRECSIISATGRALHIFTKWAQDNSDEKSGTLISKSLSFHRRLPEYHPKFLTELLMHQEYEKVKKILIHLATILNQDDIKFQTYPLLKLVESSEQKIKQNKLPVKNTLLSKFSGITISYEDEDHSSEEEESDEENISKNATKTSNDDEKNLMEFSKAYKLLLSKLANVVLPEINGLEQMHLIALINAFNTIQEQPDALDEPGSRYLISFRIFLNQSKNNPEITLKYSHVAWAMQSTTQETLLSLSIPPGTPYTLDLVMNSGAIYWVQNPIILKKIVEQLAKDVFVQTKDPTTVALYYLALHKKTTLVKLFETKQNFKVADFFGRDFTIKKNKVACEKNAFVLLGRHDYEYSAAYYLLADNIKDCVDILVNKLKNYHLAYLIARVYSGDHSDIAHEVLEKYALKDAKNNLHDEWLASVIRWNLKQYEESLESLIFSTEEVGINDTHTFDPSIYSYCKFVSESPKLQGSSIATDHRERLILRTAHFYSQIGSYLFAMKYYKKIKEKDEGTSKMSTLKKQDENLFSGQIDFGSFGGFDNFRETDLTIKDSTKSESKKKKRQVSVSIEERKKMFQATILNLILSIMCQQLHDLTIEKYTPEIWKKEKKRIHDEIDHFCSIFEMNKSLIISGLQHYCSLNGLLLSQALIHDDDDLKEILDFESHQVVTLLSVVIEQPLTLNESKILDQFIQQFLICYSRFIDIYPSFNQSSLVDYKATFYIALFISGWSKRDFLGLCSLFSLHEKILKKGSARLTVSGSIVNPRDDSNIIFDVLENLPQFYEAYKKEDLQLNEEVEIQQQLEEENKNFKTYGGDHKKTRSISDAAILKLKDEHNWEILNGLIVYTFGSNVKEFFEKGYKIRKTTSLVDLSNIHSSFKQQKKTEFSLLASTALTSVGLWFQYHHKRLSFKEVEVVSHTNGEMAPKFRDITFSSQKIKNIVSTISSAPQRGRKTSNIGYNVKKTKKKNMKDIISAIPELSLGLKTKSTIAITLSDINEVTKKVETFKSNTKCQTLWDFIIKQKSSEEFFSIGTEVEEEEETSKFSEEIEMVHGKDKIRSVCINKLNPQYLAYSTKKGIKEINIDHSIKYRRRNEALDILLDDEMSNWEDSLHRFDKISLTDDQDSYQYSVTRTPTSSNFDFNNFLTQIKLQDIEINSPKTPSLIDKSRLIGFGSSTNLKPIRKSHSHNPSPSPGTSFSLSNEKKITHDMNVHELESHPFLPVYLSGGHDGSVHLWKFGEVSPLRTYRTPKHPRITSLNFEPLGYKFGASDKSGHTHLWKFDSSHTSLRPFVSIPSHTSKCYDFCFIDSGSLVATVGTSGHSKQLRVWDLLLPEQEYNIIETTVESDPRKICYCSRNQTLLIGGKKGEISIFDMRQRKISNVIRAHTDKIRGLEIGPDSTYFISASYDNHIKIWDCNTFKMLEDLNHKKSMTFCQFESEFLYSGNRSGILTRRLINKK